MAFNIFAMPASSIILLLSAAFGVSNALPWSGPEPTGVYKEDAWSPRPTNKPADPLELFKRDSVDINVCGWLGGNSADPAVCSPGSSCIHDTVHGYVGCCTTSGACTAGVYTSCVDKNSPGGISGPLVENNGVFTCLGDQECYRNTYPGNYFQYGCGSSGQGTTVETSFTGQPTDLLLQVVFTGVHFTPSTISSTSSSSSSSSSSSTTSSSSSTSSSTSPSSTLSTTPSTASPSSSETSAAGGEGQPKSKNNHVGPIAGGTIGGLAFVIAILGIILFFYRRRQGQRYHRAGSFISTVKESHGTGTPPGTALKPTGPFHQIQPYSPDDFVSPMSGGLQQSPPMNPSMFQPPAADQEPTVPMFSPTATEYQGIQERMRENAAVPVPQLYYPAPPSLNEEGQPLVSEIENFSHSFHAAIAQMSPPTPPQAQLSNIELPPPRDTHTHSGLSNTALGIGMGIGTAAANRRNDDVFDDGETKETGGEVARKPIIRKTAPGFRSENVRMEGWQPASLRPAKNESSEPDDSTPRYQLVDQPPLDGVPVLHQPGQLRGSGRHQRQKSSF